MYQSFDIVKGLTETFCGLMTKIENLDEILKVFKRHFYYVSLRFKLY